MKDISPETTRIGWIGTGVMGLSMCGHLLEAGANATIHTRTPKRAQWLVEKGATWAASPRVVAERSDVVFTMVGFPEDVRAVYLAGDGVMAGTRAGPCSST